MKALEEHRKESDNLYARKDYEKAVRWAIIALATGIFTAVANSIISSIIRFIGN